MVTPDKFTDLEIAFISSLKEEAALEWSDITEKFNKKFKKDKSLDAIKKGYQRARDRLSNTNEYVRVVRDVARTRKANSLNSKDLRTVLQEWENREDLVDAIKEAAKAVSKVAFKPMTLPKPSKDKKGMTLELLISDVHVGKKTDTFDLQVLKRRLGQIATTVAKEVQKASEHYNVERIVIGLLGDLVESASMHGLESAKGCEFGNARQVQECITQMFTLLLRPIFGMGIQADVVAVTGNHDRTEQNRTMNSPGQENLSWIIYHSLKDLTEASGFKNVSWSIPTGAFDTIDIYGERVLYEHGDNVSGGDKVRGLTNLLSKRISQSERPIHFLRVGHFHEPLNSGLGRIIINGSVPGDDSYSTILGFRCEPSQTLNFYIERDKSDSIKRMSSYYKTLLIQLS